jgi:PAP2 superfamily
MQFVFAAAYVSVSTQIILSFIYFSHREEAGKSNELWWTATIALVITTVISGILPAMGTYEYYGVVDSEHGRHLHDLHGLRDGTLTSFSMEKIRGIISLPSYHTVLAILLTYVYRNQRRILYVALPLNLLMLISIPTQGGHYLADMFAGAAVAALSTYIFARSSLDTNKRT